MAKTARLAADGPRMAVASPGWGDAAAVAAAPVDRLPAQSDSPVAGAAVTLRGVGRTFPSRMGDVAALQNVDLSVAPGEFCVVVGPSGCGKTTFLRLVSGLDQPSTGGIAVQRADGGPASNAMVFQGHSVFPWATVQDNVAYGLRVQGVSRADRVQIAEHLLERVGLVRVAKAYPHQLSEGMRQRVAIARALAVHPDLLLMDEPFAALDEQTRLILQEELLAIWEATRNTVIFITHSIDESILLGDRIIIFGSNPGRIKAQLPVPFPRPRTLASVRSDPRFPPLFDHIWALLREDALRSDNGSVVRQP